MFSMEMIKLGLLDGVEQGEEMVKMMIMTI